MIAGEIISISKLVITAMVLFYKPYNLHRMKIFFNKKMFVQENSVLPPKLKLREEEAEESYKDKFFDLERKKNNGEIWDEKRQKRYLLGKMIKKNMEENMEFIDEMKLNIIKNIYLEGRLNEAQMKLLPLAHVHKISKEMEEGKFENKKEKDILEVYKRFKRKRFKEEPCQELERVHQFIMKNLSYFDEEV